MNRAQIPTEYMVASLIFLAIANTVLVGSIIIGELTADEFRNEICESKFGDGASWQNDSDESFDCIMANGTEISDVKIKFEGWNVAWA